MTIVLLKRFARTFLAAFLASVAGQLATGVTISSIEDLKKLGLSLIVAGISGGIMAIDKAIRYEDESPTQSTT